MTDRDLDDRDWMEDEARWAAEEEEAWEQAERQSKIELDYVTSRCATEGCEGEGTEELGDTYVCMSCYQRLADEAYERHRDREEER